MIFYWKAAQALFKKTRRCSQSIKKILVAGTPEKASRILHGEHRFTNENTPLNTPD